MIDLTLRHTANCAIGRQGQKPKGIVIHSTEGTIESALDWTSRKESQASYHYIVDPKGKVYETVNPKNTAWANGLAIEPKWKEIIDGVNPNLYTISVAFAGFAEKGPSWEQWCSIIEVVRLLSEKYKIPLDENHVIPHNHIRADKLCPGLKVSVPCIQIGASKQKSK